MNQVCLVLGVGESLKAVPDLGVWQIAALLQEGTMLSDATCGAMAIWARGTVPAAQGLQLAFRPVPKLVGTGCPEAAWQAVVQLRAAFALLIECFAAFELRRSLFIRALVQLNKSVEGRQLFRNCDTDDCKCLHEDGHC